MPSKPLQLLAGLLLAAGTLAAQTVPPTLPAYDIVSIKPNKTNSGSWRSDSREDRFAATNISLVSLLVDAYDIKDYLISGIPKEVASARFDIEAKIVEPDLPALKKLKNEQQRAMLLPVLAERFHLKAHTESRELPVYELVVLASGAKFHPSKGDVTHGASMSTHNRDLTATELPMSALADVLSSQVQRTVIDKTGLTGHYDLKLRWSPDDDTDPQPNAPPTMVTALQEQLGLKLRPAKGPVATLVVDHVEMPTEN